MRTMKRLAKSRAAQAAGGWLAALYIRLVRLTGRWRTVGADELYARIGRGEPVIGCFWHGRLLMIRYLWPRGRSAHVLISQHRDGRLISDAMHHLGIETVTGSSSRGGSGALRAMLALLKRGESVFVTPDGPRGPRMRVAPGIIRLAQMSGVPVYPGTCSVSRRRILSSWDRFMLALPFCRGVYVVGEPLTVPRDADDAALERAREELERRLNAITAEADRMVGQAPVEPATLETAS